MQTRSLCSDQRTTYVEVQRKTNTVLEQQVFEIAARRHLMWYKVACSHAKVKLVRPWSKGVLRLSVIHVQSRDVPIAASALH